MPKPTICQIHGAALGGAFELALACDFRTMAEDAVAGIMEVRVGLLPDVGGCSRLPAVVGLGNAKELIMTGKVIDGREAHRIGFANRIAPAAELDDATEALANELLACAPRAVGLAKRMDAAAKPALAVTLEQEVAAQETLAGSEDFAEGARAFFEKRDPTSPGASRSSAARYPAPPGVLVDLCPVCADKSTCTRKRNEPGCRGPGSSPIPSWVGGTHYVPKTGLGGFKRVIPGHTGSNTSRACEPSRVREHHRGDHAQPT